MNKIKKLRILAFVLLFVWMICIFAFSSQNAEDSSQTSGGIVDFVIKIVCPEYNSMPTAEQVSIADTVSFIVRKTAHFTEYFILGLLSVLSAITFSKYKIKFRASGAFLFCVLYSISDEIHQYFVPGRACRFFDMLVDSSGSLLAIVIVTLIVIKSRKICSKLGDINA